MIKNFRKRKRRKKAGYIRKSILKNRLNFTENEIKAIDIAKDLEFTINPPFGTSKTFTSFEEYKKHYRSNKLPDNIPKRPQRNYKNKANKSKRKRNTRRL